jgi:dTMP kinase
MNGRLIVFEGTDGSGKSTQFRRFCSHLEEEHIPYQKIVFPQYSEPSSALIRMYLGGEFGSHPEDVNAYAASSFYAVDRYASYQKVWGEYYRNGGLILADRYTTSNAVHQASKVPEEEREDFFRWLYEFEFDRLGLPRPDQVFYLDMPTEQAVALLRQREEATNTKADIHELDTGYLAQCRKTALEAAPVLGWQKIACTDGDRVRDIEELHREIWEKAQAILNAE